MMSATSKSSGYAPGSNRRSHRAPQQSPASRLTDGERMMIQQRLRRHYLAEDASLGLDQAVAAVTPHQPGMLARARALLPIRLIWRPSLKQAQQH